jgi:hypothetical protein
MDSRREDIDPEDGLVQMASKVRCSYCGTLSEPAEPCPGCGHKFWAAMGIASSQLTTTSSNAKAATRQMAITPSSSSAPRVVAPFPAGVTNPQGSRHKAWIWVLGAVAVVVVIALIQSGAGSSSKYAKPDLVSHNSNYVGSTVTETGTIRNDGNDTAASLSVSVTVRDAAGNIVGQTQQQLGDLAAGQSVNFVLAASLSRVPDTVNTELIWQWDSQGGCPPGTNATPDPNNPSSTAQLCVNATS